MSSWDGSKGSIEALHRYWNSRAGGLAPQRSDIDPADIKPLLPFLYIVTYERDPFRVRYILTGTEADRWNGFNLTGRYIDEFLGKDINGANRILLDAYTRAYDTAAPAFCSYSWPTRAGYTLEVRVGMFPLRVGERVQQCLGIEDYSGFSRAMADDSIPFEDVAPKRPDALES
ncbi:PAS domain-containing protein [Dongia sp. agr-C8]